MDFESHRRHWTGVSAPLALVEDQPLERNRRDGCEYPNPSAAPVLPTMDWLALRRTRRSPLHGHRHRMYLAAGYALHPAC